MDALFGIGRALETVATIALMCEPHDIGQALGDRGPLVASSSRADPSFRFEPTLFLFDHVPGGVGLAERIFEMAKDLLSRTRTLIAGCSCEWGCPACVGPPGSEVPRGGSARKRNAVQLLSSLLGG
jgi:DEAD/DEAH box helicase domain-containing protein